MVERKIGEIFICNGELYQVIKGFSCKGCAFMKNHSCHSHSISELLGHCDYATRSDRTGVIFKEINNMKIKNNQLTIDIPKGMEVDTKNSDLINGIIKFKQIDTYEDVEDTLNLHKNCTGIVVNKNNIHKLCAISKLMNIAKYYNKDWKPNWSKQSESKYHIMYDNNNNTYTVDYNGSYILNNIYFKNKEDATAVINNPNFRDILDIIYKN